MKRLFILVLSILTLTAFPVFAEKPITIFINGQLLNTETAPVIENDRVLLPLRAVFEAFGQNVEWDGLNQTIISGPLMMQIDSSTALYGSRSIQLDVPARIISDRTYVPLRFIAEVLGKDVAWDAVQRQVLVNDKIVLDNEVSTSRIDKSSLSTPKDWGLPAVWWYLGDTSTFESCSIDLSISQDIDQDCCLYIAPLQGWFGGKTFYCGIQTQTGGFVSKTNHEYLYRGRSSIFSRWDERSLDAVSLSEGGFCESAGYEGEFISVRHLYLWKQGKYRISLKVMPPSVERPVEGAQTWVGMFIYSYESGIEDYMGALRFDGSKLELDPTVASFIELYGGPIPKELIPKSIIGFSNFKVNGELIEGKTVDVGYADNGRPIATRSRIRDGEVQILMGETDNPDLGSQTYELR